MDIKVEQRRVTMYHKGHMGLSMRKVECRAFGHAVAPSFQYGRAVHVEFIRKGERKVLEHSERYAPTILVLDGWGHPEPADMFPPAQADAQGVEFVKSRYRSHDPKIREDFDAMIDAYIARTGARVVCDYRKHDPGEISPRSPLPIDIVWNGKTWTMPNGDAARSAASAAQDPDEQDVERRILELGGVEKSS